MPTPGQELSSIDFESMIGGPLMAVVRAQAQAAMTTINFIKQVGFHTPSDQDPEQDTETKEPIYVKFKYWKETQPFQPANPGDPNANPPIPATPAVPAKYELQYLEVPALTLYPIPYIRVEETTIDFNAKINSVEFQKTDSTFKISADLEAKAGWAWGSAKLKVSAAYQKSTQSGNEVNRTYSLQVNVKAVQDEMPAGMEKVLSLLENGIVSAPVLPPVPRP
jgi:hypothetical protein